MLASIPSRLCCRPEHVLALHAGRGSNDLLLLRSVDGAHEAVEEDRHRDLGEVNSSSLRHSVSLSVFVSISLLQPTVGGGPGVKHRV